MRGPITGGCVTVALLATAVLGARATTRLRAMTVTARLRRPPRPPDLYARGAWLPGEANATVVALPRSAATSELRSRVRTCIDALAPHVPGRLERAILEWALPYDAMTVVAGWLAVLAGVTLLAGLLGGAAAAAVAVVAGLGASVGLARGGRGRGDRLVDRQIPGFLDAVSAALRSGCSIPRAIADAGQRAPLPLRRDIDLLVARLDNAVPLLEALHLWRAQRTAPGVQACVAALTIAHRVGGSGARAVEGVASSRRDAVAVARELGALSTQARWSAAVMVAAPAFFIFTSALADAGSAAFLVTTPPGLACLVTGVALDAAGAVWMARIVRRCR